MAKRLELHRVCITWPNSWKKVSTYNNNASCLLVIILVIVRASRGEILIKMNWLVCAHYLMVGEQTGFIGKRFGKVSNHSRDARLKPYF